MIPTAPGAQNERTALAWRRTGLSLAIATLALARLAYERIGFAGKACLAALPLTILVFAEGDRRYRQRDGADAARHARGGSIGLVLVVAIVIMSLTGLAIVLSW